MKEVLVIEVWGGEGIYRSKGRDGTGRHRKRGKVKEDTARERRDGEGRHSK